MICDSIVFMLLGAILFFEALIGLQGIRLIYTKYGVVTGHFMLAIYLSTLFGAIVCEVSIKSCPLLLQCTSSNRWLRVQAWALSELGKINEAFKAIVKDLDAGKSVAVITAEKYMSQTFNRLFFASDNDCTALKTVPFWNFVNGNCPSSISEGNCRECFAYSASQCIADQNTCYASIDETGSACPYTACRAGFLDWFSQRVSVVVEVAIAFIVFQFVLASAVVFLLIHNTYEVKRDSVTRKLSVFKRADPVTLMPSQRTTYSAPPPMLGL